VTSAFRRRYGPWAVVAGASEGLGQAFAVEVVSRGVGVVLMARRAEILESLAASLRAEGADVLTVVGDLATLEGHDALAAATDAVEVGLVVANAAFAPVGPVVGGEDSAALQSVAVNCVSPLRLVQRFAPPMVQRGRGGIVLMSSLAGECGSPRIATYAATKAFNTALAAGLWAELRPAGVDVVACISGGIATPNLAGASRRRPPGTLSPEIVASRALDHLGRGPRVVPGVLNQLAAVALGRVLPARLALRVMGGATAELT